MDYAHPDFRNEDDTTRILALWDQTIPGRPPAGYRIGTEYTKEQIDEALAQSDPVRRRELVPSTDAAATGPGPWNSSRKREGRRKDATGEWLEKLHPGGKLGFPEQTASPDDGADAGPDYCIRKAMEYSLPVAVNISFGNTYGAHDGTSLLETYITDMANIWNLLSALEREMRAMRQVLRRTVFRKEKKSGFSWR